jgi:hypothetical protein
MRFSAKVVDSSFGKNVRQTYAGRLYVLLAVNAVNPHRTLWRTHMIRTTLLLAASLVFITSAQTADNPKEAPVVLEKKLHGGWKGGSCDGDFTFNPDGTFDLRHFSPGNNTLTGTWSLRWDALPPKLVLMCKTSDFKKKDPSRPEYEYLGKPLELKLIRLDDDALAYQYPGQHASVNNTRVKAKKAPVPLEKKLHGEWKDGGVCVGDLTLRADGTFERQHYSPGNNKLAGTWEVRWNALPPTLVLTCKTSDYSGDVGKTSEFKLTQLDDEYLAYEYPGEPNPGVHSARYKRAKK